MNLTFHLAADEEFQEAVDFYEENREALGAAFYLEVRSTLQRIQQFPNTWPVLEGAIRRFLVNRFLYAVLYSVEEDSIFVVAVMHLHRHPNYWKHRI